MGRRSRNAKGGKANRVKLPPKRVSPAGRRQVGATETVRNYVSGFKEKKGIRLARSIVEDISSFEVKEQTTEAAKRFWAKRSASEIIGARQVFMAKALEAKTSTKPAIKGCTDYAVAVTSALRAAGFDAWIARSGIHTYTKFVTV